MRRWAVAAAFALVLTACQPLPDTAGMPAQQLVADVNADATMGTTVRVVVVHGTGGRTWWEVYTPSGTYFDPATNTVNVVVTDDGRLWPSTGGG